MSFNRYVRWQLRISPVLTRFLYGSITFNTGIVHSTRPMGKGMECFPYLMMLFGALIVLDSVVLFSVMVWNIKSLRRLCSITKRWRHVLLLPCLYLYVLDLFNLLQSRVSLHAFFVFGSYSFMLLAVGVLLVIQDGVIYNEGKK